MGFDDGRSRIWHYFCSINEEMNVKPIFFKAMNLKSALLIMLTGMTACSAAPTASSSTDFTEAAESSVNGVVSIKSYATAYEVQPGDPMLEFFFGRQPQRAIPREQQLGLGSGVILSSDGYLVTNNHVIDKARRLEVTLNDNRTFDAEIIGKDPITDLALLKIDADDLPVIPMGNSDDLKVGEWVLAVGNPFGFTSTVTAGIVSAKARSIASATGAHSMTLDSFIQTDAAVNPGNSGGALVNTRGELVGINTAIYSHTGSYAGYSFAIPSSIVTKVVADLKEYGSVQRAVLGVSIRELDAKLIAQMQLKDINGGILIMEVQPRSAAENAGLQEGDIIVELNRSAVGTYAQLQEQMALLRPGDLIEIIYIRQGDRRKTSSRL